MSILRLVGKDHAARRGEDSDRAAKEARINEIVVGKARRRRAAQPQTHVSVEAQVRPGDHVFVLDFDPFDPDSKLR